MVSNASDDLPDPDTPVTTDIRLCGMSSEMFLRLWTRAPRIRMESCTEVFRQFQYTSWGNGGAEPLVRPGSPWPRSSFAVRSVRISPGRPGGRPRTRGSAPQFIGFAPRAGERADGHLHRRRRSSAPRPKRNT